MMPARGLAPAAAALVLTFSAAAGMAQAPAAPGTGQALHWPSFRGPGAAGSNGASGVAVSWNIDTGENVRWTAEIEGYSHSSPVIWGDHVFVATTVSSNPEADGRRDGVRNNAIDDLTERTWKLIALDRTTGRRRWERIARQGTPRVRRHEKGSHGNSTPATDGRHVVAVFNSEGLFCWSVDGELLWSRDLGRLDPGYWGQPDNPWGHASSPTLYEGLVIVQSDDFADSFLAAYRLADGAEAWRVERDDLATWSTPTLVQGNERTELIVQGGNYIRGYDPSSGEELWRFADHAEVKVPTPFAAGDLIIATGGAPSGRPIFAIERGATGDISSSPGTDNSHLRWVIRQGGPYTSTPLAAGTLLFVTRDSGQLAAYDLATGSLLHRRRLGTGFSAPGVVADARLYLASEDGDVFVVRADAELELLATNAMRETIFATPALSGDLLLVRTQSHLYAIGR